MKEMVRKSFAEFFGDTDGVNVYFAPAPPASKSPVTQIGYRMKLLVQSLSLAPMVLPKALPQPSRLYCMLQTIG